MQAALWSLIRKIEGALFGVQHHGTVSTVSLPCFLSFSLFSPSLCNLFFFFDCVYLFVSLFLFLFIYWTLCILLLSFIFILTTTVSPLLISLGVRPPSTLQPTTRRRRPKH